MIKLQKKSDCCGCEACVQKCSKHCIRMTLDEEGYYYPEIDTSVCVDCGLCEKVCPIINLSSLKEVTTPIASLAVKNSDDEVRMTSSSGGVFISLASTVVEHGGVVFGAVFDYDFKVIHTSAKTCEELRPMKGSKYVQSIIGNCFSEAETLLKAGKTVLFTGTPCQIAGLHTYLRKDYDNLITVDIVCHGVPGPALWKRYLNDLRGGIPITHVSFREKKGYSWSQYGLRILSDYNVLYNDYARKNPYMRAFLSNNALRPSCYSCLHKRRSGADITLGDFWGIGKVLPDFADEIGISMVSVNTEKGDKLFKEIKDCEARAVQTSDFMDGNKSFFQATPKPLSRKHFIRLFRESALSVEKIMQKVLPSAYQQTRLQRLLFLPTRVIRYIARRLQ